MTQDVVTASIRISATPEEVFPYLTDPELLTRWLADWADTTPEPGGRFAVNVGDSKVRGIGRGAAWRGQKPRPR